MDTRDGSKRDASAHAVCGCVANSYNFHGDINDAYDLGCELQRKRVECAIMIKAALDELDKGE